MTDVREFPRSKGWSTDMIAVPFNVVVAGEFVRNGEVCFEMVYRDRKTFLWMSRGYPLINRDGSAITPDAWMARPKLGSRR